MFPVKFKFPDGTTSEVDVYSVPKIGEFIRIENDSFSSHFRVGSVWHNIMPLAYQFTKTVRRTVSIDVILDLP